METLNIVLYLDGSLASRRATAYLAPLVRHAHVKLALVVDEQHSDQAAGLFEAAETTLALPEPPLRCERGATPERAIVLEARAQKPDLVVFGPLRQQGWKRWLGQSSVRTMARRLTTSMLLMSGRPNELHRALLCSAGGTQILTDARLTARLLGPLHGQTTILHIVSQMPLMFNRAMRDPDKLTEAVMSEDSHVTQNFATAKDILTAAGVTTKLRVRVGMVVEQIKDELREGGYDLMVIGAHQTRTPLDRVLLEDISTELLLESPIPVLLVQSSLEP